MIMNMIAAGGGEPTVVYSTAYRGSMDLASVHTITFTEPGTYTVDAFVYCVRSGSSNKASVTWRTSSPPTGTGSGVTVDATESTNYRITSTITKTGTGTGTYTVSSAQASYYTPLMILVVYGPAAVEVS